MSSDQQHVERPRRRLSPSVEPLEGRALLSLPGYGPGGPPPTSSPSPNPTPAPMPAPTPTPTATQAPPPLTVGPAAPLRHSGAAPTPPPAAAPHSMHQHIRVAHHKPSGVATKTPAFYPFYTGPHLPELNAVKASGQLVAGRTFVFTGTNQGPIVQGPAAYVWGVDRSGHLPPGPFTGRPQITFDAVIVVQLDASRAVTAQVVDLASGATTDLSARAVHIRGATIRVEVPASLLPSTGRPPSQYGFNYWPEDGGPPVSASVASFLPESNDVQVGTSGHL